MADFAAVRDEKGDVAGLWLKSSADAKDPIYLATLLLRSGVPQETSAKVFSGDYRVVANNLDAKGGVFLMFGTSAAPGEAR